MRRAIVVFIEDKRDLMLQFGCLYMSLKHIQSKDTELVVFGTKEALKKIPDDCIKLECKKASHPPELLKYHRINSIHCFTSEHADKLDDYDYVLRTDVDTFLTPAWNHYYPSAYTVGKGSYVFYPSVKDKIKQVAAELGFKHRGLHNLGASHYGKATLVKEVSGLAVSVATHLLTKEFRCNEGKWPYWYGGVTNMYSNEIAVNHLIKDVSIDPQNLDFESYSEDSVMDHAHIHCWHTDQIFSKLHFLGGRYDHLSTKDLDLTKIKDYCLYIALTSKREVPWKT